MLYDVAIIDENNIWAVGEIYMNDSLGNPDPKRYNAIHWDGTKLGINKNITYTLSGTIILCSNSINFCICQKMIFGIGSNQVIFNWNGVTFGKTSFN